MDLVQKCAAEVQCIMHSSTQPTNASSEATWPLECCCCSFIFKTSFSESRKMAGWVKACRPKFYLWRPYRDRRREDTTKLSSHLHMLLMECTVTCVGHYHPHHHHYKKNTHIHTYYMHATCMLHTTYMLYTCYIHATYMFHTCYTHSIYYIHAIHILHATCILYILHTTYYIHKGLERELIS